MRANYRFSCQKIQLPFKIKKSVLALGGQSRNTLCFAQGGRAYLSPLHADLNLLEDFAQFEKDAAYFLQKHPQIIASDLHPEYQSTKYASGLSAKRYVLRAIGHHHAHIAACMVDNGLTNQKVIGVAFDGTGLGSDAALWGAEFLLCDYRHYARRGHLKEVPLLGGEQAIRQPWRVCAAYLAQSGVGFPEWIDLKKWRLLSAAHLAGVNAPLASSMGRLFDAAASLILAKTKAAYEAALPIALEKLACGYRGKAAGYRFKIVKAKEGYIIDPAGIWREICAELRGKEKKEKIAYRFHLTVAQMAAKTCSLLRRESAINKVVLAGGVFQNRLLLRLALDLLYKQGFKPFAHRQLPSGDAALSVGQAVIAGIQGVS